MKFSSLISAATLCLIVAACDGGTSTGGFDLERNFAIELNAASEVPAPKPTTATGTAQILVYASRIDYALSATNITGITAAHIHSGAPGVAGPVVVTLFTSSPATGAINGVFASGSLSAANLPATVTLESLKTLLASGNAYVNVHTTANQPGEIRGQVK
ncbi:MAG TPA: CHRD domain-containing protein [Gemmatimonadaceae bacterium]|nr:CHRD domain-containing protein [Gemmatimonadaceae bacterium]